MLLRSVLVLLSAGAALAVCPNDCSGHGACNMYSMCECYRNFMGSDCSQRVCNYGLAFVDTPQGDLNADGYVSGSTFENQKTNAAAAGGWEVYPWYAGWGGTSYTHEIHGGTTAGGSAMARTGSAQGEAHLYKECSAKGSCNRGTGTCECFAGYEGEACGRTACPNGCGGHGLCTLIGEGEAADGSWGPAYSQTQYAAMGVDGTTYVGWDRWSTQSCACDAGFFGEDCSLRACPKGDDPVTKYNAYTRIKLVDDTNAAWYDTAACPTTSLPAAATVVMYCKDAGQAVDADSDDKLVTLTCVVTTAGVGYDSEYDNPVATVTAGGATCTDSSPTVTFEYDSAGNIPKGSNAHVLFSVEASGGCNSGGDLVITLAAPAGSSSSGNGYRRSRAGLLPTRVWTWEDPDTIAALSALHPLIVNDYVWSAWYSPYSPPTTADNTAWVAGTGTGVYGPSTSKRWDSGNSAWVAYGGTASPYDTAARCYYEDVASTSCKYNPIKYATNERSGSVANAEVAKVTGMASMASGVITDACCQTATNCDECNFFDILLKDVDGTFNTGDELRVSWPTLAAESSDRESGGFALCNYIESISTYYAANSYNYQQNEVQVLQILHDTTASFDGYFALEFTDEMGDTWTTEAVAVAGNVDIDATATATLKPTSLAQRIEDALEALPNNVLPDVDVDFVTPTDAGDSEKARHFTISFIENSGDVPTLGVAYSVVDTTSLGSTTFVSTNSQCGGYADDFRFPSDCTCTGHASDGSLTRIVCADPGYGMFDFSPKLVFATGHDVTMTTLDGRLDEFTIVTAAGTIANNYAADCFAAGPALEFRVPVGTDFADDVPGTQDVDYFRETCLPVDSAVDIFVTSVSTFSATTGTHGPGDREAGRVMVLEAEDIVDKWGTTSTVPIDGTTENVECSNRGICDYASGTCKCFTGFTTEDCSVQDSLAMG